MRRLFKTKLTQDEKKGTKPLRPEKDWRNKRGDLTHTEYWLGPRMTYPEVDEEEEECSGDEDYRITAATEKDREEGCRYVNKEERSEIYRMTDGPQRKLEKEIVKILANYGENHLRENQVMTMSKKIEFRSGGKRTEIQKFRLETNNKEKV
uniref:p18 protein n=1 Tax=Little cherry virus 2 TaxID=154339 RepID=A0A290DRN4_9CLOS|nr:p18 protein [Little cherry virus 2]UDM59559.1 p18 protein [Little cherry virus 2]UDM59568.1 p18 protein [Little cherry virus 2]UDM59577.1 p18 protein [Little cherry virus 2]